MRAVTEAKNLFEGTTKLSADALGFFSQRMNIDLVWLTFFVAKYYAKVNSNDFYIWQRAIYMACEEQRGVLSVERALVYARGLSIPGVEEMMKHMSKNTDIYLPPWILNYSRIYDVAAVICPFDAGNIMKTVIKPAISWRYFLSLDFKLQPTGFNLITSLWNLEKIANEGVEDIRLSERILHQAVMGRNSPLCNTNFITGNALNVKIVE